ncbi:putative methyltransferase, partial [Aspergillus steynii IBT 23096]
SSTASITSTILNYQYVHKNGRRYHAYRQGEYVIPNDEQEQERLDLHHHICSLAMRGDLYRCPLPQGIRRVLDIGTGTGAWVIDMADSFPETVVIGTDLSPIQPLWVPPNCVFEIDDFELEWNFSQPFDFIHARAIEGCVHDFPRLFQQAYDSLSPGGWFEVVDFTAGIFSDDESTEKSPHLLEWRDRLIEASRVFGKPMGVASQYDEWMAQSGFANIRQEIIKVPFGPWARNATQKELGRYHQTNMLEALEAYSLALCTRYLGWSVEQVQLLLIGVRKELKDLSLHNYSKLYVVYGQKTL